MVDIPKTRVLVYDLNMSCVLNIKHRPISCRLYTIMADEAVSTRTGGEKLVPKGSAMLKDVEMV